MPEVLSDGVRLAVEVVGAGEPVTVLAHGLTGSRRELQLFPPFLPGTKVLFDFRGHGESERPPPGCYTTDHFANDLDAVAREYGATCAGGASLGGGAILRLLGRDPGRFEKLLFLLPASMERASGARHRLLRLADLLEAHGPEVTAQIILGEEEASGAFAEFPSSREYRRQALLSMNEDGIPHAIRGVIEDPPHEDPEAIRRVQAPALVIAQEGDTLHQSEVARELAETLPNAELHVFPDQFALLREIPVLVQKAAALLSNDTGTPGVRAGGGSTTAR